jgi:hypothetical protein
MLHRPICVTLKGRLFLERLGGSYRREALRLMRVGSRRWMLVVCDFYANLMTDLFDSCS